MSGLVWVLLIASAACTLVFGWSVVMTFRSYRRHFGSPRARNNNEHGLVISTVLTIVSIANGYVLYSLPESGPEPHDWGAIVVRGALITAALYLIVRHPEPE